MGQQLGVDTTKAVASNRLSCGSDLLCPEGEFLPHLPLFENCETHRFTAHLACIAASVLAQPRKDKKNLNVGSVVDH